MNFEFSFVDINSNIDSDRIDMNLYYNDSLIDTRHLDDDGNILDDKEVSELRNIEMKSPNLPEGVYKVELRVNDDIVTKEIKTKQKIVSFINKINIANDEKREIYIYTDSKRLEATTINPGSLQTIKIGDVDLLIDEGYKQFSAVLDQSVATSGLNKIVLEKDR